jgi:hypothetical protein
VRVIALKKSIYRYTIKNSVIGGQFLKNFHPSLLASTDKVNKIMLLSLAARHMVKPTREQMLSCRLQDRVMGDPLSFSVVTPDTGSFRIARLPGPVSQVTGSG